MSNFDLFSDGGLAIDDGAPLRSLTDEGLEDIKRFAARRLRVRSWTDFERVAEIVELAGERDVRESRA